MMLWVHGSALRHVIVKGAPISRRVLSSKSRFFFKERNLRVVPVMVGPYFFVIWVNQSFSQWNYSTFCPMLKRTERGAINTPAAWPHGDYLGLGTPLKWWIKVRPFWGTQAKRIVTQLYLNRNDSVSKPAKKLINPFCIMMSVAAPFRLLHKCTHSKKPTKDYRLLEV